MSMKRNSKIGDSTLDKVVGYLAEMQEIALAVARNVRRNALEVKPRKQI